MPVSTKMTKTPSAPPAGELALDLARFLEEKKADHVLALDVRQRTPLADFFVIAGQDVQQGIESLEKHVHAFLMERGIHPRTRTRQRQVGWILMDCGSVVVHLFVPELRDFYGLEKIWGEGSVVWPVTGA
jgi:ribosome-associated protein